MTHNILDRLKAEGITSINAGYRTFQLDIKANIVVEDDECWGNTCFDKGVIELNKTMGHETARETLIHELTHVVLELSGLGGYNKEGIVAARENEEITILVSRGFLLLMNLNPELFKVLSEQPVL